MSTMSVAAIGKSTSPCDQLVADDRSSTGTKLSATNRSFAKKLMESLRLRFEHKPSLELAQILHCDVRSAQRYFAGDRVPDGPVAFYMIRNPEIGIALIEEATKTLSPSEYRRFWKEMTRAALRAQSRDD